MKKNSSKIFTAIFLLLIIIQSGIFIFFNLLYTPSQAASEWINPTDKLQVQIPGMNRLSDVSACPDDPTKVCIPWISEYIAAIYTYAMGIVGILAAIILMYAGVRWLAAGGSPEAINDAKAWIGASLTGLILALSSYLILYQVNPDLVNFRVIRLSEVEKIENFIRNKLGGTAEQYKNMLCPTEAELRTGVEIYATAYYKPPHENNDLKTLCMIAMNCSCPSGRDTSKNCDAYFPGYPNYRPCKSFPLNANYCNQTASESQPQIGDIAVPGNCSTINLGDKFCVDGTTYTARDHGSGIQGRRIDIWSSSLDSALDNTGIKTMKDGQCQ